MFRPCLWSAAIRYASVQRSFVGPKVTSNKSKGTLNCTQYSKHQTFGSLLMLALGASVKDLVSSTLQCCRKSPTSSLTWFCLMLFHQRFNPCCAVDKFCSGNDIFCSTILQLRQKSKGSNFCKRHSTKEKNEHHLVLTLLTCSKRKTGNYTKC